MTKDGNVQQSILQHECSCWNIQESKKEWNYQNMEEKKEPFLKVWAVCKKFTYVPSILTYIWRYSDGNTFTCMYVCTYVGQTMEGKVITIK